MTELDVVQYATTMGLFLCVATVAAFLGGCVCGYKVHGASKRADEELKKYEAAQKEHDAAN